MGSVNDNIQAALSPIYGAKSTNHLLRLFRTDHGLLENDRWQAYLQGTKLADITSITDSPVGSLNDIERLLFENFAELHNESTGLYFTGVSSDYISTPDHADLYITDDLCITAKIKCGTWRPAVDMSILLKWASPSNLSFLYQVDTTGAFVFGFSSNGSTADTVVLSTELISASETRSLWVGVTRQKSTGIIRFWIGGDASTPSWQQFGTDKIGSTNSMFSGSARLQNYILNGTYTWAQIYDGIGDNSAPGLGTLVAEFDASAPVGPRYRDRTGKIWTINGSAWSWE